MRVKKLCLTLLLLCFALALRAQEKSDWYYFEHTDEILPDARSLFDKGEYDRAIGLCDLHDELLSTGHEQAPAVEDLRVRSRRCRELVSDISDRLADGDPEGAKLLAYELKELNPNDAWIAKAGLSVPKGRKQAVDEGTMRFVLQGGLGLAGLGHGSVSLAPSLSGGLFNIGDSVVGAQLELFLAPGLASSVASMFGAGASAVLRVAPGVYPSAGVGFFSCRNTVSRSDLGSTAGPFFPLGVTFLVGGRFALSASVCILPEVKVWSEATGYAAGISYQYLQAVSVAGGLMPRISLGYAF